MVYARKISEDSWFDKSVLDADSLSELSTKNHELSVWKVADVTSQDQINDIALALALSRDAVDEFYIVFIDIDKIKHEYNWKMELRDEDGMTGFEAMKGEHTNFILFSFWQQGFLAEHIHNLIQDDKNYRYFDVTTLVDLLEKAIQEGRIDIESIKKYGRWNKKLKELQKLRNAS